MSYRYWILNRIFICWYKYFAGQGLCLSDARSSFLSIQIFRLTISSPLLVSKKFDLLKKKKKKIRGHKGRKNCLILKADEVYKTLT